MVKQNFRNYADLAMRDPNVSGLRQVIEKELLHYEILHSLGEAGILRDLQFQGGTALRLCHGGERYSEDLDFAGGPGFTEAKAGDIAGAIRDGIASHYGLPVTVSPPKSEKRQSGTDPVQVSTWSIRVETEPEKRNMPAQRIKIDIDTTESRDIQILQPRRNYRFLPVGYSQLLVPTQSAREILANKLVALPATMEERSRPRFRDIWDIRWLGMRNIQPDADMIRDKAKEHGIASIESLLESAILKIDVVVRSEAFAQEMSRFLPADVADKTIRNEDWLSSVSTSSSAVFTETLRLLRRGGGGGGDDGTGFDY